MSLLSSWSPSTSSSKVRTLLGAGASVIAYGMLISTITNDFVPFDLYGYAASNIRKLLSRIAAQFCIIISEYEGMGKNKLFDAAEAYLNSIEASTAKRLRVSMQEQESTYTTNVELDHEIVDVFEGVKYKWRLIGEEVKNNYPRQMSAYFRRFELTFHRKHRDMALTSYLPHVLECVQAENCKTLKLYTLDDMYAHDNMWSGIRLTHQATFETMAMNDELKTTIMDDLRQFVDRKEYYRKVGKAWKRGYLLYGPPGTGKSSLVAAIANFLNFNVYDLELNSIHDNAELRRVLVRTPNHSILVVEDVDCSRTLCDREGIERDQPDDNGLMLSGVLNFIDGLWSSAGVERIIIFTTNYKERLDPALLRAGRMDMHIYMGYCNFCGFKTLVSNYVGINNHPLFETVALLIDKVEITPAEVVELLIRNTDETAAIRSVIQAMEMKMKQENSER